MLVNVCSSGSSGSTLLSYILNRHSKIYCGEELAIFSNPLTYTNYSIFQKHYKEILEFGISSMPYRNSDSFLRNLEYHNFSHTEIESLLNENNSFDSFINKIQNKILKMSNKTIWAEKTPENILVIGKFIDTFPEAKIIHIIRDPRDSILSLMRRHFKKHIAAEYWLSSIAAIQPFVGYRNLIEIRYEDLVTYPEDTIRKICTFLNIDFENTMLDETKHENNKGLEPFKCWHNQPNKGISQTSVGIYKKSIETYDEIFSMKLTKEFADLLQCKEEYIIDLMKKYKYDISNIDFRFFYQKLKSPLIHEDVQSKSLGNHVSIPRVEY